MKKRKIIYLGVFLLGMLVVIIYQLSNQETNELNIPIVENLKYFTKNKDNTSLKKNELDEKSNELQDFQVKVDNVSLKMSIPKEWHYEELPLDKSYKYALKLYKSQKDKYLVLYVFDSQFLVCGTGRINKKIILDNGGKAQVGYYGTEADTWSDISFYELNPNVAFINEGLKGLEAEEVLNFVKTIDIK